MSSCIIVQNKEKILMGSDTALSCLVDNIPFRISNYQQKIFLIKNCLIFCSGETKYVNIIIQFINNLHIINIHLVSNYFSPFFPSQFQTSISC